MANEFSVAHLTNIVWEGAESRPARFNPPTDLTVTFPGTTAEQALKTVSKGADITIVSADVTISPAPDQSADILHLHGRFYQALPAKAERAAFTPMEGCNGYFRKQRGGVLIYTLDFDPIAILPRNQRAGYYLPASTSYRDREGRKRYMNGATPTTERHLGSRFVSYMDAHDVTRYAIEHLFTKEIEAMHARRSAPVHDDQAQAA